MGMFKLYYKLHQKPTSVAKLKEAQQAICRDGQLRKQSTAFSSYIH